MYFSLYNKLIIFGIVYFLLLPYVSSSNFLYVSETPPLVTGMEWTDQGSSTAWIYLLHNYADVSPDILEYLHIKEK